MAKNQYISDTSISDNYSKGLNLAKSGFWLLLSIVLIEAVIEGILQLNDLFYDKSDWMLAILVPLTLAMLITGPIRMSASWVFLKATRNETYLVRDMFAVFKRNYWNAVLANLIAMILIILGLILFIIPGIIIMIRFTFINFLIIDKKMGAWEAITTSWNMTKGYSWTILGMILLAIPLIIAGLICLIIGVFPVIVWLESTFAVLYHSVSLKK